MSSHYKLIVILGIGALSAWSTAVSAQIVECIDADGRKTFTEKCPPGTVKQREVTKGGTSVLPEGATQPQQTYKDEEAGFRKRQIEREEAEAKAKAVAAKSEQNCLSARGQLNSLENARRVRRTNPATGEREVLSDDERLAETDKARKAVEQKCKN